MLLGDRSGLGICQELFKGRGAAVVFDCVTQPLFLIKVGEV